LDAPLPDVLDLVRFRRELDEMHVLGGGRVARIARGPPLLEKRQDRFVLERVATLSLWDSAGSEEHGVRLGEVRLLDVDLELQGPPQAGEEIHLDRVAA
jgi:hypothetical protein